MAKRSYDYNDYWIEVTVQDTDGRFEATATIFASRDSAWRGASPVHRILSGGNNEEEADMAAAARAEAWIDGHGTKR